MLNKPSMKEVLSKYGIKLVKNKCLCPFHNEKTPSLSIKGSIFNCFGCGEKGDSISFVMKMEACDFKAAINMLSIEDNEWKQKKSTKQKVQEAKAKRENDLYWKAWKTYAENDLICIRNKPSFGEVPNDTWLASNNLKELAWDKIQRSELLLWK